MMSVVRPPSDEAVVRSAPDTPGCASHAKSWVLLAAILGSGIAFLEASVINVALPAIQDSLAASVPELQGIATAYTLALASLALAGGAAGDRFGKRRLFSWGAAGLTIASLVCACRIREVDRGRVEPPCGGTVAMPRCAMAAGALGGEDRLNLRGEIDLVVGPNDGRVQRHLRRI